MTYADDPKVSAAIRGGSMNLLLARTRRLDRDACLNATAIIQSFKRIFDVFLQGVSSRPKVHFTVVCLATRPMNASEAGGDLVLIQTSLLFS